MRTVYLLCVISAGLVAGCNQSYSVIVNGYAKIPKPISANARIYIYADPNSANPILDNQIKAKIVMFLADLGYQPLDDVNAEYRLTFDYWITAHQQEYYEYIGPGAGVRGGFSGIATIHYIPTLRYVWSQWLEVRVYRGNSVVWLGKAEASKYYKDERQAIDCLIVALFSRFGQDTKRQEVIAINKDDPRLLELAGSP
jgi:hypothetical protein